MLATVSLMRFLAWLQTVWPLQNMWDLCFRFQFIKCITCICAQERLSVNDSVLLYVNLIGTRNSALLQLCRQFKQKSSRDLLLLLVIWVSLNYSSKWAHVLNRLTYLQSTNWYEQPKCYKWLSHTNKGYAHSHVLSAYFQKCHVKGSQDTHVSLGEKAGTVMNLDIGESHVLLLPDDLWSREEVQGRFFFFFSAIGQNIWLYFFFRW